jgi:hypothetical protein
MIPEMSGEVVECLKRASIATLTARVLQKASVRLDGRLFVKMNAMIVMIQTLAEIVVLKLLALVWREYHLMVDI